MKKYIQQLNLQQLQKCICLLVMLLVVTNLVHADGIGDPGGGAGDPDAAPIDGGLSLLVAAGVGYSAKKVKELRKKK